ncbi:MAG: hypothetical protein WBC70_10995 [Candidatus Aminicenantales bacterium]
MRSYHLKKKMVSLSGMILAVLVLLWPQQAGSAENGEQVLTFSAAKAIAGLNFDREDSELLTLSTSLWFSLGNVHALGKMVLRNAQMPELEPVETYGSFFGLKVTLQLKGGWNTFSGGDLERGLGGVYDYAADVIARSWVPILQNEKGKNRAGLEFGGDLIYCITPRFGIGIGASKTTTARESVLLFEINSPDYDSLRMRPEIKISVLRLGLFYAYPFAGRLAISVHGGPALYSAKYSFSMRITSGGYGLAAVWYGFLPMAWYQEAEAKKIGLEGGVGFEFNANPFVAFFVEALGRYARVDGFEGEEEVARYQNFRYQVVNSQGPVYFVPAGKYSRLDIIPREGTVGASARKATLDFSGFSFSAGLKLRF